MRPASSIRLTLTMMIAASLFFHIAGCGSSAPGDGKQVNVTIPQEEAQKQNNAYQDYMKKSQGRRR